MIHVTVHHEFGGRGGFPGLFGGPRGDMRRGPRAERGPARERDDRDEDEEGEDDDDGQAEGFRSIGVGRPHINDSGAESSKVAELREQVESLRGELQELSRLVRKLAEDKE